MPAPNSTSLHPIPLACYLFLKYSKLTSFFIGALNLLFPLPETLVPWIFTQLAPSYHSGLCLDVTASLRPFPIDLLNEIRFPSITLHYIVLFTSQSEIIFSTHILL